jgi:membrane protein
VPGLQPAFRLSWARWLAAGYRGFADPTRGMTRSVMRAVMRFGLAVVRSLRGRDLPLHAAAVTFYGGIAVVPAVVLAIRLSALVVGPDRVAELTAAPIDAVPDVLGADRAIGALIRAGLDLSLAESVAALIPATLYGEGLRRAFRSLARPVDAPGSTAGAWRGRLLVLPLLAAGPALVLGLLLVLPTAAGLLQRGGWASFGGIVASFLVVWVALSAMLTWVYRVVGPASPGWWPVTLGATGTAANVSGFLHGFVLFWAIPVDLGLPFGGFDVVGAVVAVALWLYLLHTLALVGYVATLVLDRFMRGAPDTPVRADSGSPALSPDRQPDPRP